MKMQYKLEESRKVHNIVYIAIILLLLFSMFFSNSLSILLRLKPDYKFSKDTEIHFINVGQGDAIAIKFANNEVMLIDSGTELYKDKLFNYLDNIVLDDNTIDYLVLTHIDNDHSGNMIDILDKYDVKELYRPKLNSKVEDENSTNSNDVFDKVISIANEKGITMHYNEVGITINVGMSMLTWLSPIGVALDNELDSNNYSPVIRLDYNGYSALFTGDIDADTEELLIDTYNNNELDIDILKVAHHGSNYSTSEEFLFATTPKYACIGVGENTYGHPSNKLLERILCYDENFGTNLYDNLYTTKDNGNVIMSMSDSIKVTIITNIDDYNFVGYYVYCLIAILVVVLFIARPYAFILFKNIRFVIQNRKFEKYIEKEREAEESSNKNKVVK